MSGIDSIIEHILQDTQSSAKSRIDRAETEAERIIAAKKAQALEEEERMLNEAEAVIEAKAKQNRAAQNTKSQRRVLEARVSLINEVIAEAKERIKSLSSEERLTFIKDFVTANAEKEDGILILCDKDRSNVTSEFLKELSEITQSNITLSDEVGDFDVGCILKYGDYVYNGTLDALADEKNDELKDVVNKALFA